MSTRTGICGIVLFAALGDTPMPSVEPVPVLLPLDPPQIEVGEAGGRFTIHVRR